MGSRLNIIRIDIVFYLYKDRINTVEIIIKKN